MVDGNGIPLWDEQGIGCEGDPKQSADLKCARMGIDMHRADQPATRNPSCGSHGSNGAELSMGVADPSEDDGASQAVCWDAEERLQLDQE